MGEMSELLEEYVENTTKSVVDNPDAVEVSGSIKTKEVIIQIRVDKDDFGKIIGKKGRTVESLRVICLAIKNTNFPNDSRRIIIAVLEDEDSSFSYK